MASIQKRDNGKWRARYRDADGREHARHFPRKVDAQRWLDEVTADVVTGRYVDPRAGRTTVRAQGEAWLSAQVFDVTTRANATSRLNVHVFPYLGDSSSGRSSRPRCRRGSAAGCRRGARRLTCG
jgi:hypothetical protein